MPLARISGRWSNQARFLPVFPVFLRLYRNENIFAGEFWHQFEGEDNNKNNNKYINILHLDVGHNPNSIVSVAACNLLDQLTIPHRVKALDLWQELYHYDSGYADSKLRILRGKGTAEDLEKFEPVLAMAKEINLVDVLIVSTPMWNFSIPYILKQYIDIVIQPGINFKEKRGEPPRPVRPGRPLILFTSAGGAASPDRDFLAPYLKLIFAMVGFEEFHAVNMAGMSSSTKRKQTLDDKRGEIDALAKMLTEHYDKLTT